MKTFLIFAAGMMICGQVCTAVENIAPQYTFKCRLDKRTVLLRPQIFSLQGRDEPAPGDVARVCGTLIVLNGHGDHLFEDRMPQDGCLYEINNDGSKSIVAVYIGDYQPCCRPAKFFSPLDKMTPDEIRKLRGVEIWEKGDKHLKNLKYIDPNHTIVAACSSNWRETEKICKGLSAKIRYFSGEMDYVQELSKQKKLTNLRFLYAQEGDIDFSLLKKSEQLQYLRIQDRYEWDDYTENDIYDVKGSLDLKHLNVLCIAGYRKLSDLNFVSKLNPLSLKRLEIPLSNVRDLQPLSEFQNLHELDITGCPVEHLPDGEFHHLRNLWAIGTQLPSADLEHFKVGHKRCFVAYDWNQALSELLKGVTRIEIESEPGPHDDDPPYISETITSPEKISSITRNIHVEVCRNDTGDDFYGIWHFYRGDRKACSVRLAGVMGFIAEWQKGWPRGVRLTRTSVEKVQCALFGKKEGLDRVKQMEQFPEFASPPHGN
jgi:hypothetical protein